MINWLKDIVRPIRLDDPELGPLRYLRDTETWEGWIEFAPAGRRVEILLSNSEEGPGDQQREFLRTLGQRYGDLWPQVKRMLRAAAAADPPEEPAPDSFVLVAVDLPAVVAGDTEWELCYETEPKSWFYAVRIHGWNPVHVSAEC